MPGPGQSRRVIGGSLFAVVVVSLTALVITMIAVIALTAFRGEGTQPGDAVIAAASGTRPAGVVLPDPTLTPGGTFNATVSQICTPGYSKSVRDVSTATKNRVYAEYHITHRAPGEYEVDHLIPLEIGGSNDIKNLFPQPAEPRPGFHEKDVLENTLHDLVCAGKLELATAQRDIATDWYAAYVKYVLGARK